MKGITPSREELVAPSLESIQPVSIIDLRRDLASNKISPDVDPERYEQALRRIALDSILRIIEPKVDSSPDEHLNFSSWNKRYSVEQLEQVDLLRKTVHECVVEAFNDPRMLEVWRPGAGNSSDGYSSEQPYRERDADFPDGKAGLISLTVSTGVSGHSFLLHFNSAHFDGLDASILALKDNLRRR